MQQESDDNIIYQCICFYILSYPVEVKIEVTAVPNLMFPSVTICNLNALKRSQSHKAPFDALSDYFTIDDSDMLYDDFIDDQKREWLEGMTFTKIVIKFVLVLHFNLFNIFVFQIIH